MVLVGLTDTNEKYNLDIIYNCYIYRFINFHKFLYIKRSGDYFKSER